VLSCAVEGRETAHQRAASESPKRRTTAQRVMREKPGRLPRDGSIGVLLSSRLAVYRRW
jgi:hypothetical protein